MQTFVGIAIGVFVALMLALLVLSMALLNSLRNSVDKGTELLKEAGRSLEELRAESVKLRESQHPFLDSLSSYTRQMERFAKSLDGIDRLKDSLEKNSGIGTSIISMAEKTSAQIKAAADAVALLCSAVLRPQAESIFPPAPMPTPTAPATDARAAAVSAGPPSPMESGAFIVYDEAEAAQREAEQKVRQAGYPTEEKEVPDEQMNNAGNV